MTGLGIVAAVPAADRSSSRIAHLYLAGYTPPGGGKSIPRDRTILSEAQGMVRSGYVRWCHLCIGHAVQVMGLPLEVIRLIAERDLADGVAR